MFSWFKRHARKTQEARGEVAMEAALDAGRMIAKLEGALGGLNTAMSEDPFIVGALAAHAAILSKVISNGQCPISVTEAAMVQALQVSFGTQGVDRTKALGLLFQLKNHPEYTQGSQVTTLILAARFGRRDLQGDPLLVNARERIRSMPRAFREAFGSTEEEQISEQLSQELLIAPLKTKHGEVWRK